MKKTKLCRYCKEEIHHKATVCNHCEKKQGMTCGETLVATVIIVFVMVFGLRACGGISKGYNEASKNAAVSSEASEMGEVEYKSACISVSYEEFARDKNALEGQKLTFTGEVIQVLDDTYRINITKDDFGYSDTIIFEIDSDKLSEKILEGDVVTIWGESRGFISYESTFNEIITVPHIRAVYIENNVQTSNRYN